MSKRSSTRANPAPDERPPVEDLLLLLRAFVEPRLRGGWTEDHTEDVVHGAAIRALRRAGQCKAESPERWRAWVHSIARRQIAELHRGMSRRRRAEELSAAVADHEADPPPPNPLGSVVRAAEADALPDLQELLYRRFVEGERWGEIGMTLGVSAGAAKRRFQRFVRRVRELHRSSPKGLD